VDALVHATNIFSKHAQHTASNDADVLEIVVVSRPSSSPSMSLARNVSA